MADKEKIQEALAQIDPLDDDQWTTDGAPKVDTVEELLGESVTRKEIVEAAPDFNREKAGEESVNDDEDNTEIFDQEGEQVEENTDEVKYFEEIDPQITDAQFMSYIDTISPNDLENFASVLSDQKSLIDKEIEEKKAFGLRIKKAINVVNLRVKQLNPNTTTTAAIRQFIESQNQTRIDRVARRKVVLQHLSAKDLEPRSAIDAAMARKNKRGSGRPSRPIMK